MYLYMLRNECKISSVAMYGRATEEVLHSFLSNLRVEPEEQLV